MSCADLRLDEYLDGELDPPARAEVEGHLAACATCRDELEKSRRLESLLLKAAPAGAAPDADTFVRSVHTRSRRTWGWGMALAAAAMLGILGIVLSSMPRGAVDVRAELARYAAKKDMDEAERRIASAGPDGLKMLELALDDADVKIQFAAATILFKHSDESTRTRVMARFQPKTEKNGWTLMPVGIEEEDAEILPVAVNLAVDGQDRWAMDMLRKLRVLNRLDKAASSKVIESVATLLHSTNPKVQKLALDIVKELGVRFPLTEIVGLLDSPELGEEALRFLRDQTKKDFGKDKDAWKKAIEHEEEL